MAIQSAAALDRTFRALADGTRRAIIRSLTRHETRSAGELGSRFHSSQPTISKHLKVLERARLIERVVEGRVHRFRLRRTTLEQAEQWIARHRQFWNHAVDRLEKVLEDE
jgi:DNA-binding transcriptional ArsR family regulator